ncbi:hypothetical protein [Streptomyces sp. R08]|uniref:Uncharacterized protein n=1 Tax=Streptomyces sp. R08 TaxID=3238624 RepID=A0AB39M9Z0_9ACTN
MSLRALRCYGEQDLLPSTRSAGAAPAIGVRCRT